MAQATVSLSRRTLLGAVTLVATPSRGPGATSPGLPAAPAGKIWVCVPERAWTALCQASGQLVALADG